MPKSCALIDLSSSLTIVEKRETNLDTPLRWWSIRNFLYLACTSASTPYNVDIYSKVWQNVRIFEFFLLEAIVGIPYMFMDFFIKQYTRRLDSNKNLNPLLRGISYGIFMQTALWTLINAAFLADCLRFLVISLKDFTVSYSKSSKCQSGKENTTSTCIPSNDLIYRCKKEGSVIMYYSTCVYHHYEKSYVIEQADRTNMTTRFFIMAVLWIGIFLCSSITEEILLKFFKLIFMLRTCCSVVALILLVISAQDKVSFALYQLLDISKPYSFTLAMDHVCYTYGIGFLGLYDLGTLSPYIIADNAVVIFMVFYTIMTFIRSWVFAILYLALTECVVIDPLNNPHIFIFGILPLATSLFSAQKLYILIIYANMALASLTYVTMLTLSMAKFLQNEFESVKQIYIVGLLCFFSVFLSLAVSKPITGSRTAGILLGLNIAILHLGCAKALFVMWIYGVQRFSTDIQFWLGFKPTKFWRVSWLLLPLVLFGFMIRRVFQDLVNENRFGEMRLAETYSWLGCTMLIVFFFIIKTFVRYIAMNNLAGLFKASAMYGSIDSDDRKRRMLYNEVSSVRKCQRNCMLLDELIDCYHVPLSTESPSYIESSSNSGSYQDISDTGTEATSVNRFFVHMDRYLE